jgi:L-lactate dehydrogenase (cytochrome)
VDDLGSSVKKDAGSGRDSQLPDELVVPGAAGEPASAFRSWPVSAEEWERQALEKLPAGPRGFIEGGAGCSDTVRENRHAFSRWRLMPQMLASSRQRDLSVTICGQSHPGPVLLAPIGVQTIAHQDGEVAVARAAETCGTPFLVPMQSSFTMEQIAAAMPGTAHWFQLYFVNDRDLVVSFVRRAEAAGYSAIAVTLDTPMLGWRERDLDNKRYLPFRGGAGIGNFLSDPYFRKRLGGEYAPDTDQAIDEVLRIFNAPENFDLGWDDLRWLRSITRLPLFAKGILRADDAARAFEVGFDGLIVSNHGGRQVDGSIGALDAMVQIRAAVGPGATVMMDGGIRRGSDVIKALALGANAVFVGRPYMYGLTVGGRDGVIEVLSSLLADTHRTLGLVGRKSLREIDAQLVWRR